MSRESKNRIEDLVQIKAEPAIMEMPREEVLVGGPIKIDDDIPMLADEWYRLEDLRKKDPQLNEILNKVKEMHKKMDALLESLSQMNGDR